MKNSGLTLTILFFIIALAGRAQEKTEKERGVRADEVPAPALEWIAAATGEELRIQWYYEETSGRQSYEAKFKLKDQLYSVEFKTNGAVEDVEIVTSCDALPVAVRDTLTQYFESNYNRYKIHKIQQQWTGSSSELAGVISGKPPPELSLRYEIEFFGKADNEKELWEGLFDANGQFIKRRRIVLRPTDNLNY